MSVRDQIRARVRELYGKRDAKIAQALIDEEIVTPPKKKMTPADLAKWTDGVRRTVNNHRRAIDKEWSELPLPKPGDALAARKFIAKLQTRIEELDDIVEDPKTKSTARMNAYGEIRHLETLIAQVQRVDTGGRRREDSDDPDAPQSKLPFAGVVIDFRNVSAETRSEIERERHGTAEARAGRKSPKVQVQR